jgi:hypothetical protein
MDRQTSRAGVGIALHGIVTPAWHGTHASATRTLNRWMSENQRVFGAGHYPIG